MNIYREQFFPELDDIQFHKECDAGASIRTAVTALSVAINKADADIWSNEGQDTIELLRMAISRADAWVNCLREAEGTCVSLIESPYLARALSQPECPQTRSSGLFATALRQFLQPWKRRST